MATQHLALPAYAQLSDADEAALTDLYRRGMSYSPTLGQISG
jgi:hypothetical protein